MSSRTLAVFLVLFGTALGAGCGGAKKRPEAVLESRELPPADPRAVKEFVAGARLLARNKPITDRRAQARFERALAIDGNLWEAHYNLGVVARRAGETRKAVERFEAARAIQPGAVEALLALAEARYALGERKGASELLGTLIASDPNALEARIALAAILREQGEHRRALVEAREVLVRDPARIAALAEVGRVHLARGRHDVAALVFRKALDLATGDDAPLAARIQNDLGLLELERGDTQAAFMAFEQAIRADARYTPARLNKGGVLLRAGDYQGAAAEYRAALQVDTDDLDARVALGVALRGLGKNAAARREYEQVLEAAPLHPAALFNLAVLRAEFLDERPRSRALFQRFLEVAPSDHRKRKLAERYLREIPASDGGGS